MAEGHTIKVTPADEHVEVWIGDEKIADTDHPVLLDETGLPTRYYLPKADVRMDLLTPTTFETTCPFKGQASYWSLELDGTTHDGIVWGYENPLPNAEGIKGLVCFYPERVELKTGA